MNTYPYPMSSVPLAKELAANAVSRLFQFFLSSLIIFCAL